MSIEHSKVRPSFSSRVEAAHSGDRWLKKMNAHSNDKGVENGQPMAIQSPEEQIVRLNCILNAVRQDLDSEKHISAMRVDEIANILVAKQKGEKEFWDEDAALNKAIAELPVKLSASDGWGALVALSELGSRCKMAEDTLREVQAALAFLIRKENNCFSGEVYTGKRPTIDADASAIFHILATIHDSLVITPNEETNPLRDLMDELRGKKFTESKLVTRDVNPTGRIITFERPMTPADEQAQRELKERGVVTPATRVAVIREDLKAAEAQADKEPATNTDFAKVQVMVRDFITQGPNITNNPDRSFLVQNNKGIKGSLRLEQMLKYEKQNDYLLDWWVVNENPTPEEIKASIWEANPFKTRETVSDLLARNHKVTNDPFGRIIALDPNDQVKTVLFWEPIMDHGRDTEYLKWEVSNNNPTNEEAEAAVH